MSTIDAHEHARLRNKDVDKLNLSYCLQVIVNLRRVIPYLIRLGLQF